mgnify:CR=1 FL=1
MITIILDIFDFLNLIDIQTYLYSHISNNTEWIYFYRRKKQWIEHNICPLVQKIFIKPLITYPFIHFNNKFLDVINYIRHIYPNDFMSSIVLGQDNLDRPFIIIKYKETIFLPYYRLNHSQIKTLVLFKHPNNTWSCTSPFEGSLFSKDHFREFLIFENDKTSITYKRLKKMYRNETIYINHNTLQYNYCIHH